MKINVREAKESVIINISGGITMGKSTSQLRDTVDWLLRRGRKKLVLDLGEVPHVDAAGLGALVHCYTESLKRGRRLELMNLTRKVRELLVITKLITVFENTHEEASLPLRNRLRSRVAMALL